MLLDCEVVINEEPRMLTVSELSWVTLQQVISQSVSQSSVRLGLEPLCDS